MLHWSDKIKREFYSLEYAGELNLAQPDVFMVEIQTEDGLTHLQLFLQVCQKQIIQTRFKALGCPCCLACLNYLSRQIHGQPLSVIEEFSYQDLIHALQLPRERYASAFLVGELVGKIIEEKKHLLC